MRTRAIMRGYKWVAVVVLAGFCLSACSTPVFTATASPGLTEESAVTSTTEPASAAPAPDIEKRLTPAPSSPAAGETLAEVARQVQGERLISLIHIPALDVYAYVIPVGWELDIHNADESAWDSPDSLVGWAVSSALPGDDGNILLYGHNNIYSSVFRDLYQLQPGDEVTLITGEREWRYRVAEVVLLPEEKDSDSTALVEYLKPTRAPRLTIISCYPPESNTHRVIVIARPVEG